MNNLWWNRFSSYIKEINKYLRYILTGHLLIVLLFLFGWVAANYNSWVAAIPPDFPISTFLGVVFAFVITPSVVRTFFKQADQVFLLPIEAKLTGYLCKSFLVSFMMQGFVLVFVIVALMPLINGFSFGVVVAFLLLLKLINMVIQLRGNLFFTRFLMNIAITILFFGGSFLAFLHLIVLILLATSTLLEARKNPLPWERFIEQENQSMARFYRLANLFTDVPHLQNRVVERKWLNFLLWDKKWSSKNVDSSLHFLLRRTFLRANDYFGLYLRLTLLASALLYFMPNLYAIIIIVPLTIYLTAIQLLPIVRHYDFQIWLDIYPISIKARGKAVIQLLVYVLIIQLLCLTAINIFRNSLSVAMPVFSMGIGLIVLIISYAQRKFKT